MTKLTVDSQTRAKLNNLEELIELCDESGRTLGYFHPTRSPNGGSANSSPFSDEEIEQRRKQPPGRPLAEIVKELKD